MRGMGVDASCPRCLSGVENIEHLGCTGELGSITAGGVLSDHSKSWLGGFVLNRGYGSAIEAEFWGLLEGFGMAWRKGFRKMVVETDSMAVIQLIAKNTNSNHPLFSIIKSCKSLISEEWDCSVKHVFREGNMVANGLANLGNALAVGVYYFEDPLSAIAAVFDNDVREEDRPPPATPNLDPPGKAGARKDEPRLFHTGSRTLTRSLTEPNSNWTQDTWKAAGDRASADDGDRASAGSILIFFIL
ncbi:hypothetical protein Dsin_019390 [Dipteronia sinensis]|uniref:RNase H type-1 domain-containing protein n=1 Tax=Dipteronia sinensis TaxID=43782 RepID=A0AAE0A7U8_9ROSI|nr:hypothetical protein Dsin_019390 [Dipteronia sinensis]